MTEPTEPTEPAESEAAEVEPTVDSTDPAEPATMQARATDDPDDAPGTDDDAAATEPVDEPVAAPEETSDEPVDDAPAADPVTLPDESNSRTSELAARLRQSALAQVEAARASRSHEESQQEDQPEAGAAIPALDEAGSDNADSNNADSDKVEPHFVREPASAVLSEPVAVAAAAIAEAQAAGSQTFLSGPAEPQDSQAATRVRLATIGAAVLALAGVVVLVLFARSSSHDHAITKARAEALAAARPEVALALTYDYRTLDADFATAEKGMSRVFRAKYAQTAATDVTPLAKQTQAVTTGTVAAAGVISATTSTVRVLVFADQTNTNKLIAPRSRLDSSAIEVTMVKQSGRWVIDDLEPF
jgi:Mce-associated membrane protein